MDSTTGEPLVNTSILPGNNQYDTPISGTFVFDTATGAGSATAALYEWGGGTSPFEVTGFNMQAIGDGTGGSGTLMLGNMLFNWNGNTSIPVSIVFDAQGFFAGDLDGTGGLGATPASDGIYIGSTIPGSVAGPGGYPGYMGLGPIPIATTAWNTTDNCATGINCLGNAVSGVLPLIEDTMDSSDYTSNTGAAPGVTGIGGTPMLDGPFKGYNFNFDITEMTLTGIDINGSISANCDFDPADTTCIGAVPVPAAVWLFGSGLLGLLGVARRRKSSISKSKIL